MLARYPYDQRLFAEVKRAGHGSLWQRVGEQLRQRATRNQAAPNAMAAFGHWLLKDGKAEAALRTLDTTAPPLAARALLAQALKEVSQIRQANADPGQALALQLRAFELAPAVQSDADLNRLLHLGRQARQLPGVTEAWRRQLAQTPSNKRLLSHISIAFTWLGRFAEAHAAAARAGRSLPVGLPPTAALAGILPAPSAAVLPLSGAPLKTQSPQSLVAQAHQHLAQGDETQALAVWHRLVNKHPRFVPGILGLAELHHRQGRRAMALQTWQKLLKVQKPRWRAHLQLANELADHNLFAEAREALAPVFAAGPGRLQAHRELARVEAAQGNIATALAHWKQIHAAASDENMRVQAEAKMVAFVAQLGSEPRKAWLAVLRADWQTARSDAKREQASVLLAATHSSLGMMDEALTTLTKAQADHPSSVAILRMALTTLKQRRQTAAALRWLQTFIAASPVPAPKDQAWALGEMADLHTLSGDPHVAETLLAQAQKLAPQPRLAVRLAQLQERLQATDPEALSRAQATLQAAQLREPSETVARAQLELHARQGHWEQAFAIGTDAAKIPLGSAVRWWEHLLGVCLSEVCLSSLEHLVSTQVPTNTDADEIHLRLLERLLPAAVAAGHVAAQARQQALIETGLAPLGRYLVFAAEPQPERIALAGLTKSMDLTRLLVVRGQAWLEPKKPLLAAADKPRALAALWALAHLAGGLPPALVHSAWAASSQSRVQVLYGLGSGACASRWGQASPLQDRLSAGEAVQVIKRGLTSRSPDEALMAVWALGQFDDPEARQALTAVVTDPTSPTSLQAMAAAWSTKPSDSLRLQALASATSELVALGALSGLANARSAAGRQALWTIALQAPLPRSHWALAALARTNVADRCWSLPLHTQSLQGWMATHLAGPAPSRTWSNVSNLLEADQSVVQMAMLPVATWSPGIAERALARLTLALQKGESSLGLPDFVGP